MDIEALTREGLELSEALTSLAMDCHVKSDDHNTLLWESSIIQEKCKDLKEDCGLKEHLKHSQLISGSGLSLAKRIPKTANRVKAFHRSYSDVKQTQKETKHTNE